MRYTPPARARTTNGRQVEGESRTTERPVYLAGRLSGDITTSDPVIVGETAIIHADIRAPSIVVIGEVHGDLSATESIEIREPGKVFGNLVGREVIIEPGGEFYGTCRMTTGL